MSKEAERSRLEKREREGERKRMSTYEITRYIGDVGQKYLTGTVLFENVDDRSGYLFDCARSGSGSGSGSGGAQGGENEDRKVISC